MDEGNFGTQMKEGEKVVRKLAQCEKNSNCLWPINFWVKENNSDIPQGLINSPDLLFEHLLAHFGLIWGKCGLKLRKLIEVIQ